MRRSKGRLSGQGTLTSGGWRRLAVTEVGVATIKERVQAPIRSARVMMDGGVELVDVTEVTSRSLNDGRCHGCPMSMLTLQAGIERIIHVPERGRGSDLVSTHCPRKRIPGAAAWLPFISPVSGGS